MNAIGWQIGAILIGLGIFVVCVYTSFLLKSATKIVDKTYKIVDYNEKNIQETIERAASISKNTDEIMSLVNGVTSVTKILGIFRRR